MIEAPSRCETAGQTADPLFLAQGVLALCETTYTEPELEAPEAAVCDRLAYLEAKCLGVNAYRDELRERLED